MYIISTQCRYVIQLYYAISNIYISYNYKQQLIFHVRVFLNKQIKWLYKPIYKSTYVYLDKPTKKMKRLLMCQCICAYRGRETSCSL